MEQYIQNLSFEVIAAAQNVEPTITPNTTPIKVKIKMKKGDNKGILRRGVISVPKMKPTYPEITRTVRSDETIMSFNINMKIEPELKPRRQSQNKFFHLFKTGKCLDIQSEDENDPPYILTTAVNSNKVKSEQVLQGLRNKKDKINVSKYDFNVKAPKNINKPPNIIFGKCKPGGCLDPPFGEDNYQYYPSVQKTQELKEKEIEVFQEPCKEKPEEDMKFQITVKNSDYLESNASSTYMLYKASSKNKVIYDKYSDSIITYPTRTSSRDLSVLERSSMSRKSSSVKNRQINIDTYFTPSKISNRQEKKRESVFQKSLNNDDQKVVEKVKRDLSSCNVPDSNQVQVTILPQADKEKTLPNPEVMVNENDLQIPHLVKVSDNVLLTVKETEELIDSHKSKPDEMEIKSGIEEIHISVSKSITSGENKCRDSIAYNNELITKDRQQPLSVYDIQDDIENDIPTPFLRETEENTSQMSAYDVNKGKSESTNVNLITKTFTNIEKDLDQHFVSDIEGPNIQTSNHSMSVLDTLHIGKINDRNLKSHEYSDVNLKEPKKNYSMIENDIELLDNKKQMLKETGSLTKFDTLFVREVIEDKDQSNIIPPDTRSSIVHISSDFDLNKEDILQNNEVMTVRNISVIDNVAKDRQTLRLLNRENISDKIFLEDTDSLHGKDKLSATLIKDITDLNTTIDINHNNIESNVLNKTVENNNTESEKVIKNKIITNEDIIRPTKKISIQEKRYDNKKQSKIYNNKESFGFEKRNERNSKNSVIINTGFQTYENENGDILLKTFDISHEPQRFSEADSLNCEPNRSGTRNITGDTSDTEKLEDSLASVYKNYLIPAERLIKNLRLEIDRINKYRYLMRKKSIATKNKLKPTFAKRCVCSRKLNKLV